MDAEQARRLTEIELRARSNTHRIDDMSKRQNSFDELVSTVKVLVIREERVEKDISEIKKDVKSITGKSGKQWESMVDKIVMVVVAAIVGYFLSHMGIL